MSPNTTINAAASGQRLSDSQAMAIAACEDLARLCAVAEDMTLAGHGTHVSFSKKVFIPAHQTVPRCLPLLHLRPDPESWRARLSLALTRCSSIARSAARRCRMQGGFVHAWRQAGITLSRRASGSPRTSSDYDSTLVLSRTGDGASRALKETGLLPHSESRASWTSGWLATAACQVSASQGIMLESLVPPRLMRKPGMAHHGSPDKASALEAFATLSKRQERTAVSPSPPGCSSVSAKRASNGSRPCWQSAQLHETLRPYSGNHHSEFPRQARPPKWQRAPEPTLDEHIWTIAAARLIFGSAMNIQAPPNLARPARWTQAHPRRHQRLGRRLAGHPGPRQPRSAVAPSRPV